MYETPVYQLLHKVTKVSNAKKNMTGTIIYVILNFFDLYSDVWAATLYDPWSISSAVPINS